VQDIWKRTTRNTDSFEESVEGKGCACSVVLLPEARFSVKGTGRRRTTILVRGLSNGETRKSGIIFCTVLRNVEAWASVTFFGALVLLTKETDARSTRREPWLLDSVSARDVVETKRHGVESA